MSLGDTNLRGPVRNNVRFKAPQFGIEAALGFVNANRLGKELAEWLHLRLGAVGFAVSIPLEEDWGWAMEAREGSQRFLIGCGNVQGSTSDWLVFAEARVGFLDRISGRTPLGDAPRRLCLHLDAALRKEPGVSEIQWFRVGPDGAERDHGERPV